MSSYISHPRSLCTNKLARFNLQAITIKPSHHDNSHLILVQLFSDKSAILICYKIGRKKSPVHISICAWLNMMGITATLWRTHGTATLSWSWSIVSNSISSCKNCSYWSHYTTTTQVIVNSFWGSILYFPFCSCGKRSDEAISWSQRDCHAPTCRGSQWQYSCTSVLVGGGAGEKAHFSPELWSMPCAGWPSG